MSNFEITAKFGGTSVARPELVRRHVEHDDPPIVVVSAPGFDHSRGYSSRLTDLLLPFRHGPGDIGAIRERNAALIDDMSLRGPAVAGVFENIGYDIQEWRAKGWPVEALGEYWSAQLYAAFLGREMVDATEVVRTDRSGRLDVEASRHLARRRFESGKRYVVPGFYGADADGNVHTLGRGGSDITPAVIGPAVQSAECHVWSDVDGFMTADPARYADARLIPRLEPETAISVAETGCQLLHPEACRLLGNTAVTIVMRNTFGALGNQGTRISNEEF